MTATLHAFEYLVSTQIKKISPEIIRQELSNVQSSIIEDKKSGRKFLFTANISQTAKEIPSHSEDYLNKSGN
ncbi:MAG: hypothetical protein ACD_29C00270G0003 [uncultured bacterium]|nr:MAG: hypothetical protein ACD_29C00270G0003 [uncultured bacterium]